MWEANRKIFLYPQNWLEPEFRQDKTPLFAELEGALLQEDVTDDKVEDAFLAYLNGLEGIARLRVVATHVETGTSKDDQVLHVVASTYTLPRKHYYRRFASHAWSAWSDEEFWPQEGTRGRYRPGGRRERTPLRVVAVALPKQRRRCTVPFSPWPARASRYIRRVTCYLLGGTRVRGWRRRLDIGPTRPKTEG